MLQKSTLCILCSILVWGSVGITYAGLVNGDFSDETVTYSGNITYEQIGIGWIAKGSNNIPDWVIRNNQLDQVTKSGSKTRIGQVFDASDMKNTGWRFEFTLSGENLGRTGSAVVIFGGVDAGTNAPDQRVLSLGGDSAPVEASGEWTQLVDLGETEAGSVSVEITQDLSDYDLIAIRFMSRSTEGDPILSISDLQFLASRRGLPPDGVVDVPLDVVLEWEPDEPNSAVTYDVYFGTDFNDVSDADRSDPRLVLASQGQTAKTYDPGRLDFGQTYYWRIDEVNAPPTPTVFEGNVWSFTTELIAYPIDGNNITATASSTSQEDTGPENTIDESGLDANDLHSTEPTDMWLSGDEPNEAWIKYELNKVHKLHEMWVWNSNSIFESSLAAIGFKDVSIEYLVDGNDYTTLDTTHEFARASGVDNCANTTVDLNGIAAKHVKLTANSNWGGLMSQYSLSEVRFLYIPVRAREPYPDSEATDVDLDVVLGFRAGREAAKHDVYLSTDEQAVIDGNVPAIPVTEASHGPLSLDLGTTYYWKINEVNVAEATTTWQGDIWNFTTHEYFIVDDFEDYNDWPGNIIYETWEDGYQVTMNGSQVGYIELPYAETTIVHGGDQSMPFFYDNTGTATYSEATRTFAVPQDWTKHGIKALTLRFFGDPNNAVEQMYVNVNDSKFTYDGDAENLKRIGWQMWYIDLADFGLDLSNVTELSIGFERIGAFGGQGVVYFDGIRLYSHDRQVITPAEAGTISLQAHYEFEGTYSDSSGNARHGTAMGSPTFVAGKVGQAINLRGLNDYVEITGYKGILGPNAFSITTWIKTTYMGDDPQEIVYYGTHSNGQRCEFRVHDNGYIQMGNGGGQVRGLTTVTDGGWHHVAATITENATNSSSDVRIYVDGQDDTQESTDPDAFNLVADWDVTIGYRPSQSDRFFNGEIDDVRIYDRVLSQEEMAWLAGRTKPFDKPF